FSLSPGHFFPAEVNKGLKGRKVVRILLLGPDPQINFHPGWIGFASRKNPLHGIVDLMSFWITGPFHHHEMGIIILVELLIVLLHGGGTPATKIEPSFRIQRIAV